MTSVESLCISSKLAWSSFIKTNACWAETIAPPTRSPFKPAWSIIQAAESLMLFPAIGNPLIAGELPSGFGNLVSRALQYCTTFTWIVQIQLQQIDCAFCRFTGSIPTSFGKLKELTSLKLQNNELLYAFPDELSQLSKLHTLWLQNNQLTFLPDSVQELTALVSFKIASNRIAGVPHHTCWTRAFNPAVPPQALCQIWGVFMLALILLINMDSSVLRRWTSVTIRSEAPSILWLSNWSTSER